MTLPESRSTTRPARPACTGWRSGFRIARARHPVGRSLALMVLFSFLCLPFIGQMPVLADQNLGIAAKSTAYGWLYACFGLGRHARRHLGRAPSSPTSPRRSWSATGWSRSPSRWACSPGCVRRIPAYVVLAVVGFFYFSTVTALSTVLQMHLAGNERGRVMALWMMAFGGTVPIGNLVAGPLIDATSVTTVVFPGAIIALGLAWWADLLPRPTDR